MRTIEEIYAALIAAGVNRGYSVVPEFSIPVTGYTRSKKIDLVWLTKREPVSSERCGSLRNWIVVAGFEIEGCNVPLARVRHHIEQLKAIREHSNEHFPCYMPLYSQAFHRNKSNWDFTSRANKLVSARMAVIEEQNGKSVLEILNLSDDKWQARIPKIKQSYETND